MGYENEITPQSNFVDIGYDGYCLWYPRYDHSLSLCTLDVTWFPFDEQNCGLIFESWNYNTTELELVLGDITPLNRFRTSDEWKLIGVFTYYGSCYTKVIKILFGT